MKITVLIENQGPDELQTEHGLAFYIEYDGRKYLLDAGSTARFMENAKSLRVDLKEVDEAVLSHAHYDHSGGFDTLLKYNTKTGLYLRAGTKENCYSMAGKGEEYIGIPRGFLKEWSSRIHYIGGDYCLAKGVYLIPHKIRCEERTQKAGMFIKTSKGSQPDTFAHEQTMVFQTLKGLVLLNSCSHTGIDTIVREIKETFPDQEIYAVIGGFHLMRHTPDQLAYTEGEVQKLAQMLLDEGIEHIYTGHCTGTKGYEIMRKTLGERIEYMETGKVIEL